jgi:hypothetical protein
MGILMASAGDIAGGAEKVAWQFLSQYRCIGMIEKRKEYAH